MKYTFIWNYDQFYLKYNIDLIELKTWKIFIKIYIIIIWDELEFIGNLIYNIL